MQTRYFGEEGPNSPFVAAASICGGFNLPEAGRGMSPLCTQCAPPIPHCDWLAALSHRQGLTRVRVVVSRCCLFVLLFVLLFVCLFVCWLCWCVCLCDCWFPGSLTLWRLARLGFSASLASLLGFVAWLAAWLRYWSVVPCTMPCGTCPGTCDMRHATCDMRHATCDMRHATCDPATCDMRPCDHPSQTPTSC